MQRLNDEEANRFPTQCQTCIQTNHVRNSSESVELLQYKLPLLATSASFHYRDSGMTTCRLRSKAKFRQHETIQHQKQYLKQRQCRSIPNNSLSTCIYQIKKKNSILSVYIDTFKKNTHIYIYLTFLWASNKYIHPFVLAVELLVFSVASQDAQSDAFTKTIDFQAQTLQLLSLVTRGFGYVGRSGGLEMILIKQHISL